MRIRHPGPRPAHARAHRSARRAASVTSATFVAFTALVVGARPSAAQGTQQTPTAPATPALPSPAPSATDTAPSTTGTPQPTPPAFEGASGPAPGEPAGRVLTLPEVERSAVEQQPQMRVARAQTGVAQAGADINLAPLLPQVVGSAIYTHQWGNFRGTSSTNGAASGVGGGTSTGASLSNSFDVFSFGVTAQQLIYDFGQTTGRYHAAESTVD